MDQEHQPHLDAERHLSGRIYQLLDQKLHLNMVPAVICRHLRV